MSALPSRSLACAALLCLACPAAAEDLAVEPDTKLTDSGKEGMYVTLVGFSPDGKSVVTGGLAYPDYPVLKLCPIKDKTFTIAKDRPPATPILGAFSTDGRALLTCCQTGEVVLWDMATLKIRETIRRDNEKILAASFFPNNNKMLVLAGGFRLKEFKDKDAKKDKDGTRDTGESKEYPPGFVVLWDAIRGKEVAMLTGHKEAVLSVAVSPDGKLLATGSQDGSIKLWDLETKKELGVTVEGHRHGVRALAFDSESKTLLSGGDDKVLHLWDVKTGKETAALAGHARPVTFVAFGPDGKTPISSSRGDFTIRIWDVAGEKERLILHKEGLFAACALSSDGKRLVAAGEGTICIWEDTSKLFATRPDK
jgi:WD40 repeat protein